MAGLPRLSVSSGWRRAILPALIILSGCATTPSAIPIHVTFLAPPSQAAVVVIRPWNLAYGARDLGVKLNDILVAELPNQSFTIIHTAPGPVRLAGEGGTLSWPRRELELGLTAGETLYVVWNVDTGFSMKPGIMTSPGTFMPPLRGVAWTLLPAQAGEEIARRTNYVLPRQ
jgi:hypothetical protein